MNMMKAAAMTLLTSTMSFGALAATDHHPSDGSSGSGTTMPMATGSMPMGKGGMMGGGKGMMDPEMMQKKQAMMMAHMKKMEQHQANIEGLLKELVALQKAK